MINNILTKIIYIEKCQYIYVNILKILFHVENKYVLHSFYGENNFKYPIKKNHYTQKKQMQFNMEKITKNIIYLSIFCMNINIYKFIQ